MEASAVTVPLVGGKQPWACHVETYIIFDLIVLNKEKSKQINDIYIIPHTHVLWSMNKKPRGKMINALISGLNHSDVVWSIICNIKSSFSDQCGIKYWISGNKSIAMKASGPKQHNKQSVLMTKSLLSECVYHRFFLPDIFKRQHTQKSTQDHASTSVFSSPQTVCHCI